MAWSHETMTLVTFNLTIDLFWFSLALQIFHAVSDLYGKMTKTFADLKAEKLKDTRPFKMLISGDWIRAAEIDSLLSDNNLKEMICSR